MDPRVKPEDDEEEMLAATLQRRRLAETFLPFVILGLDPRIHA
jgi:hypothetical protein